MTVSGVAEMSAGVFQGLNVQRTDGTMVRSPMYPQDMTSTAVTPSINTCGGVSYQTVPVKASLPR
jgi:hypothetical protein